MSFGDCKDDAALRAGWKQFCRRLEAAGDDAFKDSNPAHPLHRADAFRFLTQNLGQAFDLAYETKDPKYPVIHAFCTPFCKLGGDNADYIYQQAWIDGESVYRITGNRGTCSFFNIAVQGQRAATTPTYRPLHEPFGDAPQANLFGHEMHVGWDGSFEVFIGGEKRGPNWLPTTHESRKLFIRHGFDDWDELPAQIRIERIGMDQPRPMPTPQDMIAAMDWAGNFLTTMMHDNPDWAYEFAQDIDPTKINQFPTSRRSMGNIVNNVETDRRRGRSIYAMCWKLAPDEAMIIEWDRNDFFWMMTNMGIYQNSMDYLYRPVSLTPSRVKEDDDGKVRIVMAHKDPGFHNWLDTSGLVEGMTVNRNSGTDHITVFHTKVVKHIELEDHLPNSSVRVTPDQRNNQMLSRFHSIQRRYLI